MAKAETLVRSYVEAGFAKIHLDASMACADDPEPLPPELIARARGAAGPAPPRPRARRPVYVIGTEVPGARRRARGDRPLAVTRTEDLARTIEVHEAGLRRGRAEPRPGSGCWRWWCSPAWSSAATQVVDFVPERARGAGRGDRRACRTSCSRPTRPTTRPRRRCAPWSSTTSPSSRSAPG